MICLSTTAGTPEDTAREIEEQRPWIDLVELRLDRWKLSEQELLRGAEILGSSHGDGADRLPRIVTVRCAREGGEYRGGEKARGDVLIRAVELLTPEYVELEDDFCATAPGHAVIEVARARGCAIIRSKTDTTGTPDHLDRLVQELDEAEGDLSKLVVTCGGSGDLLRLFRAAEAAGRREPETKRIIYGLGSYGVPSRLLPNRFASAWTYASAHPTPLGGSAPPGSDATPGDNTPGAPGRGASAGAPTAPADEFTPRELVERFAHREVLADAPLFGVLGDPVLHSGSPAYHNDRFRRAAAASPAGEPPRGAEPGAPSAGARAPRAAAAPGAAGLGVAAYIAFPADDLGAAMELFDALEVRGVSVTIPHKEGVLAYLRESEAAVGALGACNTLLRRRDGGWFGRNTDVPGFLAPLRARLPRLAGLKALVIGAGGAARGVIYALLTEGVSVTVANRSRDRAARLVMELQGVVEQCSLEARGLGDRELRETAFDMVVQTTSVGMDGASEPVPDLPIRPGELLYDIIYTPPETPLIKRGAAAGAVTVTGDLMFRAQAEEQSVSFLQLATAGPA